MRNTTLIIHHVDSHHRERIVIWAHTRTNLLNWNYLIICPNSISGYGGDTALQTAL